MVGLWMERCLFYYDLYRDREHFFGEIKNGKMILSPTGVIADLLWHEITNHSKFVELGDFVVMPNHIHGILILDKPNELKYNWESLVFFTTLHFGDNDTTGAIAGMWFGALRGYDEVNKNVSKIINMLEFKKQIKKLI
jgi:REP element-mobilizing transposase RayT